MSVVYAHGNIIFGKEDYGIEIPVGDKLLSRKMCEDFAVYIVKNHFVKNISASDIYEKIYICNKFSSNKFFIFKRMINKYISGKYIIINKPLDKSEKILFKIFWDFGL